MEDKKKKIEKVEAVKEEPKKNVDPHGDVNASTLGSFEKEHDVTAFEKEETEKTAKSKKNTNLNFTKFSQNKKKAKVPKLSMATTKANEKIGVVLRNKKHLKIIWLIEMLLIALIITVGVTLTVLSAPHIGVTGTDGTWWNYPIYQTTGSIGMIMAYISFGILVVPFFVLLVTFFVGINGMLSSRPFHIFFWVAIGISLLLMICVCFLNGIPLALDAYLN